MEKSSYEFHGGKMGEKSNNSIDNVYQELISLRESNRMLEKRIKTLEKQNLDIAKNLHHVGNNEPTRPVFNARKIQQYNQTQRIDEDDQPSQPQISRNLAHTKSSPMIKQGHQQ